MPCKETATHRDRAARLLYRCQQTLGGEGSSEMFDLLERLRRLLPYEPPPPPDQAQRIKRMCELMASGLSPEQALAVLRNEEARGRQGSAGRHRDAPVVQP